MTKKAAEVVANIVGGEAIHIGLGLYHVRIALKEGHVAIYLEDKSWYILEDDYWVSRSIVPGMDCVNDIHDLDERLPAKRVKMFAVWNKLIDSFKKEENENG